ncbi:uncharacterized protein LOC119635857 [Glossina fuscipes]|uniref:Uncharacterized protein LOC119635857 n=1 Tax=Glossina fuscipes TaxID=7396 RepID=A0A9C5YUW1_9MUSC|nr:uncharacterized protein LOC119635857 [Glossina fuscipes]KAI9583781.1 hypothetical protein GQX74_005529 [Glossina fuscipes]
MCLTTYLIWFLLAMQAIAKAQDTYRSRKSQKTSSIGQSRTFGGLLNPFNLAYLSLNGITRPTYSDYAGSSQTYRPSYNRPTKSTRRPQLADPYYGYGYPENYGPYPYYNHGGYPLHGAYYPPIYYGGYPPQYGGSFYQRPPPINQPYHPPTNGYGHYPATNSGYAGQTPGFTNPGATTPSTGGYSPAVNSAQITQLANLLGQLLGQQLRPLLNPGGITSADTPSAKI